MPRDEGQIPPPRGGIIRIYTKMYLKVLEIRSGTARMRLFLILSVGRGAHTPAAGRTPNFLRRAGFPKPAVFGTLV